MMQEQPRQVMQAKILDATPWARNQSLAAQPGEVSVISSPNEQEEDRTWQEAARQHFRHAYDAQEAIYDAR